MVHPQRRSAAARHGRRLVIDRLEDRRLFSVSPTDPQLESRYNPGYLPRLGDALADVVHDYARFTATRPGNEYQLDRADLMQRGQYLGVEGIAALDGNLLARDFTLLGATGVVSYGRYVNAYVPLDKLDDLSHLGSLQFAYPIAKPMTNVGLVTSQADVGHNTRIARPQYAVDGSGVTVGVLSDSFDSLESAAVDRASGDLPLSIQVLEDLPSGFGTDEGRAMIQLINDLAPGASLAFATAFTGQAGFANNIQRLAQEANADIIVDDVGYFEAPFFQDGIVARAVDAVNTQGITYFSSAGNSGRSAFDRLNWSSVRSFLPPDPDGTAQQFRPAGGDGTIDPSDPDNFGGEQFFLGGDLLAFGGPDDLQSITIAEGGIFHATLQWDQPYFSLTGQSPLVDLDFYILNEDGDQVVASSTNDQVDRLGNPAGIDPFERLFFFNDTGDTEFNLAIVKRYAETRATFYNNGPAQSFSEEGDPDLETQIQVELPGQVRDIDVSFNIDHPITSDLTVTLVAPDGDTEIDLVDGVGGTGFIGTTIDDQSLDLLASGGPRYGGRFRIDDSLNETFAGLGASGVWTLRITDGEDNNITGTLLDWSITVTTDANPQADPGRLKYIQWDGPAPNEYFFGAPTIVGHANARGANATGAVPYTLAPGFGDNQIALESFSSEGDVPILFDAAGNRLAAPEFRDKPDILGIDGTNTTFFPPGPPLLSDFEGDGRPNFFGTSAAAPHVAGIAALMLHAVPDATPDEIQAALQGTALPVPGSNAPGLAQADLAIGLLARDRVGSINGSKFNDLNGDGVRQSGEPPLEGFKVFLDQNNSGLPDDASVSLNSNRVPRTINDNSLVTSEIFALGIPAAIKELVVRVDIDHTATSDLILNLISPTGTLVELVNARGGAGDNFRNTIFDSDDPTNPGDQWPSINVASAPFNNTAPPFSLRYQPNQSLTALTGENPNGIWRLEIRDTRTFNVGALKSWSLDIIYAEPVAMTDADGDFTFPDLPLGGYRVTDLLEPEFPGWQTTGAGNVAQSSAVLFSEIDPGNTDAFELANFGFVDIDTTGWSVIISDSPYADINEVNPTVWRLPNVVRGGESFTDLNDNRQWDDQEPFVDLNRNGGWDRTEPFTDTDRDGRWDPAEPFVDRNDNGVFDLGEVIIGTDSPSNNYFGSGIFWNTNNTRIGSGWAMLVDNEGSVRDWVGWGWTEADLAKFEIEVPELKFNGQNFAVTGLAGIWNGGSVERTGVGTMQRRGTQDRNVSLDWEWFGNPSVGAFNVNPRPPFIVGQEETGRPVLVRAGQRIEGIDIGNEYLGSEIPAGLPAVVNHTPQGPVLGPVSSVTFNFTEPMDTSSFSLDDIVSFLGPTQRVLDQFLTQPNPAYNWTLHDTLDGAGFTAYVLDFTSQTWRSAEEVNEPLWRHWLTVLVPDVVRSETALLLVDGGSRFSGPPDLNNADIQQLAQFAAATGSVTVHLPNVPNQPLQFSDDLLTNGNRSEDEIIASSFEQALRNNDPYWAALLPMVRSAVKAMDATQEFTGTLAGGVNVAEFVVTGASKRGWTTWLTAAADRRVKAIMPMVFDALNLEEQFRYHGQVYADNPFFTVPSNQDPSRQYSVAIEDYVNYGIVDLIDQPGIEFLTSVVDPYSFRDRLTMPKYAVVSAGDEFFLNDSTQFYFDGLPEERYLRYVPNTGHSLSQGAIEGMVTFYKQVLDGDPLPSYSWTFLPDGSIQVQTGGDAKDVPASVRLWQANNPDYQDFRNGFGLGPTWSSTLLGDQGNGTYLGRVENPLPGWTGLLVELTYDVGEQFPLVFTSEVRILNDGTPLNRANSGSDSDGGPPTPLDPPSTDLKGQITGFDWSDDGLHLTIFFQTQAAEGDYQLTIGPDIRDPDGNRLDQNRDGITGQSPADTYTAEFSTRSQIEGNRYADINGDGVRQAEEPGLVGLRVYLDLDGDRQRDPEEPSTLTDESGHYTFSLLTADSYTVAIELRPGFTPTAPASGRRTVSLGASQTITGINFGERPSALVWQPQGPAPILDGQVEGLEAQNNPVAGAIQTVAAHPDDSDVVYVGTVNGGIWRTTNARAARPTWTPQTDDKRSLSIGALEFDPTDGENRTLVAGIGRYSSLAAEGGERSGLLRTENGGQSWTELASDEDDPTSLNGKNISGVAPRGNIITVGVDVSTNGPVGLYRSSDTGQTFALLSGNGTSGLPAGPIADLVGDPSNDQRLYAGVTGVGLFRSDNGGATWVNITGIVASDLGTNTDKIEFAVHSGLGTNAVYVAIINDGQLANVYRSGNAGGAWFRMDLPVTFEDGEVVGLNPEEGEERPGGQGFVHFSIVADPTDPFVVFVGGDRQPNPFPNSIGAENFSGRLFRGDAIKPSGLQWRPITHDFAYGGAPHADSREMVFLADAQTLLQTDDGGIYRLLNADSNSTDITWESMNGNLQITEFHSVDFDAISRVIMGGTQDVGTTVQSREGNSVWQQAPLVPFNELGFFASAQGDGGVVQIDDSDPNQSIRYGSAQNFFRFARQTFNQSNTLLATEFPTLIVQGTGGQRIYAVDPPQFYTPFVLNRVNPTQMVIGTQTHVFESFNQGDTLVDLGAFGPIGALAYGGRRPDPIQAGAFIDNPAVLYVGAGANVFFRQVAGARPTNLVNYPGGTVEDIVVDPNDFRKVYVIDGVQVWKSDNAGQTWSDITGNLDVGQLRSIEFARFEETAVLLVGGNRGVAQTLPSVAGTWRELGNLPNAPVTDLRYDARGDYLLAGTLGRGAWGIVDYLYHLGADRQPQAPVPATVGTELPFDLDFLLNGVTRQVGNSNPAGGLAWYQFTAGSTGTVSIAAQTATGGGTVQLAAYDHLMRPLASPVGGSSSQQVNVNVVAGQTYYVQVGGTQPGVALALGSQVAQSGSRLTVQGTAGNDQISLLVGAQWELTVNGLTYTYDRGQVSEISIVGGGGNDTATITATTANDAALLQPGASSISGAGYRVELSGVSQVTLIGGGGFDQVEFRDSSGNDVLAAQPDETQLTGQGYSLTARGFESVRATASGGFDQANLFDGPGDDQFTARPTQAQLVAGRVLIAAAGFDTVRAQASTGNDSALLYDSAGDDQLTARPTVVQLTGTNYSNQARGFDSVRVQASSGNDTAQFYDSTGDDQFVGRADFSQLTGPGYFYLARGFDAVRAYGSSGYDTAALYDSAGDDQLVARPDYAQLSGSGFLNYAKSFDEVRSFATGGQDSADLFDSGGDDQYVSRPDFAQLIGPGFFHAVRSFEVVRTHASGGSNQATFFGAADDDVVSLDQGRAQITSGGYSQTLSGFGAVRAYAAGGSNRAELVDQALGVELATGSDTLRVTDRDAALWLYGFRRLTSDAPTEVQVAGRRVSARDFLFSADGNWLGG